MAQDEGAGRRARSGEVDAREAAAQRVSGKWALAPTGSDRRRRASRRTGKHAGERVSTIDAMAQAFRDSDGLLIWPSASRVRAFAAGEAAGGATNAAGSRPASPRSAPAAEVIYPPL